MIIRLSLLLVLILLILNFIIIYKNIFKDKNKSKDSNTFNNIDQNTATYWFKKGIFGIAEGSKYCLANQSVPLGRQDAIHLYDIGADYLGEGNLYNGYSVSILQKDQSTGLKRINQRSYLNKGVWCYGNEPDDADYSIKNQDIHGPIYPYYNDPL